MAGPGGLLRVKILPPQKEQPHIVSVLRALETAVQQTEAILEKLKAVKQGLLHDLLTRGIDANGQLRLPQTEAPHLYKESPLGWTPKEWEVHQLQNLLADVSPAMRSGPFGSALLKDELVEQGLPLLGIDNVYTEQFVTDFRRFVTPLKFAQLSRYAVRPSDLMITIMGTVGRCCLVPDDIGLALSSKHTWTISIDRDKYSPYLAMLQMNYAPWIQKHFAKDQQGGTMMAIRSETLRSVLLPVPSRNEQLQIEAILLEASLRIDSEQIAVAKLHEKKRGLMDDLLTGRVRVTPLLEKAA
ncbi:MAG: restriction endonuclease subunit S [Fibrobacteres bacterium]|nr:restriction endonuclease subunit S [Fibrobacterota bacterium]